jgi:excisionase family DNA binding protein
MPWLTTEEAAKILNYDSEYVRRLLREGRLKGKKFGTIWMIYFSSVQKRKELLNYQDDQGYSKNDPRRGRK